MYYATSGGLNEWLHTKQSETSVNFYVCLVMLAYVTLYPDLTIHFDFRMRHWKVIRGSLCRHGICLGRERDFMSNYFNPEFHTKVSQKF